MMGLGKRFLAALLLIGMVAATGLSADVTGNWATYDDKTGKKKSIVKITKRNGKLYGTVVKLFNPAITKCEKCKGRKHNQNIVGMQVLWGLSLKDGAWQGGKILDPKNGKTYRCKIWEEGNRLKVRGYIAVFFRTQTWRRR